ncbi:MAG: DUF433 domain-containing protein [Cytophagaceae bacterium]|nr:DUF433 domain-containing protein [Cytophagaceae bacterium]MBK9933777.1 DUF433 domain-containing protein [Cytophagaceae bacterium]MBL0302508.1 DUF433 domain-containing protein [Cytophagaceae bacterium]MBL0325335.1 DUF433 domain-containing protein [Cytophagaceae bacterium]
MKNYQNFIEINHQILLGKPIVKGSRIAVELILRKMSQGAKKEDILEMYPNLKNEEIEACFEYAADILANEEVLA